MKTAPHHRSLTCTTRYECRLPECMERQRAYHRTRGRAISAGQWQPLTEAAPVRHHIATLQATGMTIHRIAMLAGLTDHAVRRFIQPESSTRGRKHRTTTKIAEAVLAVSPADPPAVVNAAATRRRIQALVACGWPMQQLSLRLGLYPTRVQHITQQKVVRSTTEQAVAALYEELRTRRPERNGVTARQARQARDRAISWRWPTPKYWAQYEDAIGDPDFVPSYGESKAEQLAEEAIWLITQDFSRKQAAQRLGISSRHLERVLSHTRTEGAAA